MKKTSMKVLEKNDLRKKNSCMKETLIKVFEKNDLRKKILTSYIIVIIYYYSYYNYSYRFFDTIHDRQKIFFLS